MKTNFSGYYSYSKSELRDILSNSLLTLDYSFLLDINKLSHGRLILETLSNFKDRLWLPYDTAWMYHQKIQKSIEEQISRVDTAKKYLTSFKNAADDPMNHPYIGEELTNKYDYLMKIAIESLEKESKYFIFKSRIYNTFHDKTVICFNLCSRIFKSCKIKLSKLSKRRTRFFIICESEI